MRISPGHALAYSDLAAMAAVPKAQRAVGTVIAHNAIAVLIPCCHRVIRENGDTGLYRWSATRKRALISWEQSGLISSKRKKLNNSS